MPGSSDPIVLAAAQPGPAAAAAHPRRGAPLRARLPPAAPRGRGFESIFDELEGRRAGPATRAAPALRLGRADASPRPRRSSKACPACRRRPRAASTRSCTRPGGDRGAWPAAGRAAVRRCGSSAHRNFGPYFVGNASSASGTWFQNLAASLLVYRLTHSAFLLGVLTSATSSLCCCSRRGPAAPPTVSTAGACCSSTQFGSAAVERGARGSRLGRARDRSGSSSPAHSCSGSAAPSRARLAWR